MSKQPDEYSPEEAERRTEDLIRRAFALPHKPLKQVVGTTPRAKAMRKFKRAKARRTR